MKRSLIALALVVFSAAVAHGAAGDKPPKIKGKINSMRLIDDAHGADGGGDDVYFFSAIADTSAEENDPANGFQFNWVTFISAGAGTHTVRLYGPSAVTYDGWSDLFGQDFSQFLLEAGPGSFTIEGHVWYGLCVTQKGGGNLQIFAGWDRGLEK